MQKNEEMKMCKGNHQNMNFKLHKLVFLNDWVATHFQDAKK